MRNFISILIIILILLLIGLGGYSAYRFVAEDAVATFTDTILFVMALVGLLVALASIGIWAALRRILHEDIAREISRVEKATRNEALSRMAKEIAGSFWNIYEVTHNVVFRDQALKLINDAREILEGRRSVDVEELKCYIYNNLAFACAERGEAKDTGLAHSLINYVMERCKDFPKEEIEWHETYAYVLYRLPKKSDDKEKAQGIIKELIQRPDLDIETKHIYRQRYSISNT